MRLRSDLSNCDKDQVSFFDPFSRESESPTSADLWIELRRIKSGNSVAGLDRFNWEPTPFASLSDLFCAISIPRLYRCAFAF